MKNPEKKTMQKDCNYYVKINILNMYKIHNILYKADILIFFTT